MIDRPRTEATLAVCVGVGCARGVSLADARGAEQRRSATTNGSVVRLARTHARQPCHRHYADDYSHDNDNIIKIIVIGGGNFKSKRRELTLSRTCKNTVRAAAAFNSRIYSAIDRCVLGSVCVCKHARNIQTYARTQKNRFTQLLRLWQPNAITES